MKNILFHSGKHKPLPSIALLIMRIVFGAAMLTHGYPKLMHFAERSASFSDPLGVGASFSLGLTVFAEVLCSILIILGLGTRFAALALAFTMGVVTFVIKSGQSFGDRELPILYLAAFVALIILGAGKYSLDKMISGK